METKAKLSNLTRDLRDGGTFITFKIPEIPQGIGNLQDKDLLLVVKPYREKRSLTANAYYWTLVGKMAPYLQLPTSAVHNILLRRYGTLEIIDGSTLMIFIPDTEEAEQKVLLSEAYHLKPTSQSKNTEKGRYMAYLAIKGSHEYDTKEMATLIDGAVSEAQEMGIETLPTAELERMMEAYEEHYAKR